MKPIDFQRFSWLCTVSTSVLFLCFSLYLALTTEDWFRPTMGVASACALIIPRIAYKKILYFQYVSISILAWIELALLFLLTFNGIGSLGFYITRQYYDMVLHIVDPLLITVIVFLVSSTYIIQKNQKNLSAAHWISLLFSLFSVFMWEVWEYVGDQVFGTRMFGQEGEARDTFYDIVAGIIGIGIAYGINKAMIAKRFFDRL